jgi:hypothetical protein
MQPCNATSIRPKSYDLGYARDENDKDKNTKFDLELRRSVLVRCHESQDVLFCVARLHLRESMDPVIIDVYRELVIQYHCSGDDILENPELRLEFLTKCRSTLGHLPEQQLLHRLTYLRKSRRLSKSRDLMQITTHNN